MTTAGDVIENPVTGAGAVVRSGTEQTAGAFGVVDLYIRPRGAVVGGHRHTTMDERFTVLRGRVDFRLAGQVRTAEPGAEIHVPAGVRQIGGMRATRRRSSASRYAPPTASRR